MGAFSLSQMFRGAQAWRANADNPQAYSALCWQARTGRMDGKGITSWIIEYHVQHEFEGSMVHAKFSMNRENTEQSEMVGSNPADSHWKYKPLKRDYVLRQGRRREASEQWEGHYDDNSSGIRSRR